MNRLLLIYTLILLYVFAFIRQEIIDAEHASVDQKPTFEDLLRNKRAASVKCWKIIEFKKLHGVDCRIVITEKWPQTT